MNHSRSSLVPSDASLSGASALAKEWSTLWRARRHVRNWPMVAWLRHGATRPVELRLRNGLRVACRPGTSDWTAIQQMCLGESYSVAIDHLAKRPRSGVVLDLGANIGCFSLCCAAECAGVRIVAFEAERANAAAFRSNLALNPTLARRIVLETRVVSGTVGTSRLSLSKNLAGTNIVAGHIDPSKRQTEGGVASFAELVRQVSDPIELVKMDVEGSEFAIADETPAEVWERIPAIVMEIHEDRRLDRNREWLVRRLESFGYAASPDKSGRTFFVRSAPRWFRSPLQSATERLDRVEPSAAVGS